MRERRSTRRIGLLAALLTLACALPASAEPRPEEIDAKERGRRERRLGIIALRYMTARKRYPSRCPRCQGSGKWRTRRGQRFFLTECKQCAGNGAWVSDKHYRIVHYDMRTPAFRKLPGIKDLLDNEYRAARAGKPWPRRIARIRIKDVELIDATHAVAWVGIDADKVPTETRWIWIVPEGKKKGDWFAYDARSDGRWPGEDARGQYETMPTGGWDALAPDEHRAVRQAVAEARLVFRSIEYRKRGGCLLVRLVPRDAYRGARALAYVGGDAVKLTRSIFGRITDWREVETEWLTEWTDPWDRVATKPAWWAALSRAQYTSTRWQELEPQAAIDVLRWRKMEHPNWTPVSEGEEEEEERQEQGQDQDQDREGGQGTGKGPERRAPPPPVEPEPEIDPNFEIPELSNSQRKAGDKALAKIQTLFERAKKVNQEGAQARQEGAHALWQEKLAEVRSILGEIEDVWNEEIVPAMPGGDDMERDLVANHYFGDVWGDLDRLKAMVRKVSSAR